MIERLWRRKGLSIHDCHWRRVMVVPPRDPRSVTSALCHFCPPRESNGMTTKAPSCQRTLILLAGLVLAHTGQPATTSAKEYWVAPDGNDQLDGRTRRTAWASPSRGQPTRINEAVAQGALKLSVYSTEGFLPSGRLRVGQHTVVYVSKTERSFVLAGPWPENTAAFPRPYSGAGESANHAHKYHESSTVQLQQFNIAQNLVCHVAISKRVQRSLF